MSTDIIISLGQAKSAQTLRDTFMSHDDDSSGTVDTAELGEILRGMGVDLSQNVLASVLRDIDKDGTGTMIVVHAHGTYSE